MKPLETSTDYTRPYRPLPVALLNRAGRVARRLGLDDRMDVDRMIAAARRNTGLSDFGDEWFLEPLHILVESINEEAALTPVGVRLLRARIVSALAVRLRVERLLLENPEIHDLDLGKVVVIAGLQRTATTTLHRLIAADPGVRALRSWEALNPAPLTGERLGDPRGRLREAKLGVQAIRFLSPDFLAVHPLDHDAPEEDILLLDTSFMSQSAEATMRVPRYARWLEAQDHRKPYEYLVTLLRILHWQRPGRRWVLKTPHHLEHLDVILEVFGDVAIVQTHRDPKRSIPSFCSMVAHATGMWSDHVDPKEIAAHWMRKTLRMIERSMDVRRSSADGVFVDVLYRDLVADPIGALRAVYRSAGIEFTEAAGNAAKEVAARDVKDRHGRHVYTAASFGLDDRALDETFGFYRRAYGIPDESGS
ncbi:MAG: sulfotransferase [Acidobacteriota bacterium]|nr:sulfotransferase [Acidobacteriota bacterium]